VRRPGWLTVALAGAGGFLCGVLLVAILGGPKGVTRTTTTTVHRTVTAVQTQTVDTRPTVPGVVGERLPEARDALDRAGLKADVVDHTLFGIIDASHFVVTRQDPAAGARVPPGAHVTLTVDRG
jgi:beta-lactam-binding protein with PASTA domain